MKHTPLLSSSRRVFYSCLRNVLRTQMAVWTGTVYPERDIFSMKQSMLQSLMSLWKEILALSSSTLLSRDWTLASNILRSGGWCACLLSRTKSPLEYLFSAGGVLEQPPESVTLSWRVQTKDPIRESRIPGRNTGIAGELLPLWYPKLLLGCM
jgi:hypothetical protein